VGVCTTSSASIHPIASEEAANTESLPIPRMPSLRNMGTYKSLESLAHGPRDLREAGS
jgi:hypothetical protein